jgi:hypothetical protein
LDSLKLKLEGLIHEKVQRIRGDTDDDSDNGSTISIPDGQRSPIQFYTAEELRVVDAAMADARREHADRARIAAGKILIDAKHNHKK